MDNTNILILGATNMPWNLDGAFRRRFQKRIYIQLPGEKDRYELLSQFLANTLCEEQLQSLAKRTERFSCADIEVLVTNAAKQAINMALEATHFKKVN